MARRAASKKQQNNADSSSLHSLNQAQSAEESNTAQMQMPLQPQDSQYMQQPHVQLVSPMQSNSDYSGMSQHVTQVEQQQVKAPVFTSTPYGADSAPQAAAMPVAPFLYPQYAQYAQYSQFQPPQFQQQQPQQPQPQQFQQLTPILLGTYTPKIDDKGRVALPAKFRAQLGTGFVMARGQERCVYVLPMSEFQRMTTQIQRTSMSNKSARDYLRVFLSGAVDEQPDKQGRIVVPPMLRDYASLGSEIVVIGVGTRAEIWNKSSWEAYLADREQGYSDIADDVLPAVM